MPIVPPTVLPKRIPHGPLKPSTSIQVSPLLLEAAASESEDALRKMNSSKDGLAAAEAERRLQEYGPNVVAREARHSYLRLLGNSLINPLVILLFVLAAFSFITGGFGAGIVVLIMVFISVVLPFVQEARASSAAAKLQAMISVHATVLRDGQPQEVPLSQLVPGDVVQLAAGDMIPADVRLLSCKDLFLIQGSLTGESFPVEKFAAREGAAGRSPLELTNVCYLNHRARFSCNA